MAASAPGPLSSNLLKEVWSMRATRSRTALCSAATGSNQLGRRKEGRSSRSMPAGANQFGRSHPALEP